MNLTKETHFKMLSCLTEFSPKQTSLLHLTLLLTLSQAARIYINCLREN